MLTFVWYICEQNVRKKKSTLLFFIIFPPFVVVCSTSGGFEGQLQKVIFFPVGNSGVKSTIQAN